MPNVLLPPVPLSQVGRAAHDVGLAGLLGGNLYGRLALHPSVTAISDERERGRVVNAAWRRYGTINALSVAAVTAGWVGARLKEADSRHLSAREERLAKAKDALVAATALTGFGTAILGTRFAKMAPEGGVPLSDGDHTAPTATPAQKRTKRALNVLGAVNLVTEAALVAVNAALNQEGFRRPPRRKLRLRG
jgi:hypothetical protein